MTDTYSCGITMHRPTENLYELLGLEIGAMMSSVEARGYELMDQGSMTPSQRYAWKALSDPNYQSVYFPFDLSYAPDDFNTECLYEAGFFDDGLPKLARHYKAWNPAFFTTPTHKVIAELNKKLETTPVDNPVVLVSTGGFSPIHNGHIEMMEQARVHVELQGWQVVGGFFAPGHDSYVGKKYNGTAAISAADRCAMIELAVQDSDWLECDPWAARYMPAEINFTDVMNRLQDYLRFHVRNDIQVFYVFGSDNAGFAKATPFHVVVERSHLSSKIAREGDTSHLNPKVAEYFENLKTQQTSSLPYLIRNEEDETIKRWDEFLPVEDRTKRRTQLQSAIRLGIAQLLRSVGYKNKVVVLNNSVQIEKAKAQVGNRKTLSLDPFFEGTVEMASTRYFYPAEAQQKPAYRAERVGYELLSKQANKIPEGEYVLVEDDTVTGGTIASVLSLLPKNVKIVDQIILSDYAEFEGDYYDVVDLRDFIMGSSFGGLSVLCDSHKARAPYVAPFVSLRSRAKIPAEVEKELSLIIWQANYRFFQNSDIKIKDCDIGFRQFAAFIGFDYSDTMEDFCKFHLDILIEGA